MKMGKLCSRCGKIKRLKLFYTDLRESSGYRPECIECDSLYYKKNTKAISSKNMIYRKNNKEVIAKRKAKYYKKNNNKIKNKHAIYYLNHKDKINSMSRKYYINNLSKIRDRHLRNKFNLTTSEYNEILKRQDGKGAICGINRAKNGKILSVDHNHKTNEVRGLLCISCNCGIGYFKDDISIVKKAVKYLGRFS